MIPLFEAAQVIFNPLTVALMGLGVTGGLLVGAIPGLSATMAMAIITPLTFTMGTNRAFAILCAVYVGAISGGLYSATLLRIPGTSSSIATTFDAFPLARKGQAGTAIGVGLIASFIGGTFSFICLTTIAPLLSRFALKFGPHEYFAVSVLGLSTIASVISESTLKGLIACLIGLLASTVGLDIVVGVPRFTLGLVQLTSGFDILSVLIGMFAIPQILADIGKPKIKLPDMQVERISLPFRTLGQNWLNFLRSSIIGTWIGLLPGAGGSVSSLLAYDQARRASKTPEKFGHGSLEAVVASETANNAVIGGSMIPLLTLGIPGDTPAAVMLSALMIHGLQPGPLLFRTNPDSIYAILLSLYASNIMMIIIAFWGAKYIIRVLSLSKNLLLPLIAVMCFVGTFAVNNRMFDVWVMIIAGLLGYVMEKYHYPVGPAVLGMVLGPIVETNLRQAIQVSKTGFVEFFTRPLSGTVLLLVALNFLWPLIRDWRSRNKAEHPSDPQRARKVDRPMISANRLTGLAFLTLSVVIFWSSGLIPQTSIESPAYGPSFYPRILSACLGVLSLLLLIFPRQDSQFIAIDDGQVQRPVDAHNRLFWFTIILLIAYPLAVPIFGYVSTSVLFLFLSFYSLGEKKIRHVIKYLIISVVSILTIFFVFESFFNVILPHGFIF